MLGFKLKTLLEHNDFWFKENIFKIEIIHIYASYLIIIIFFSVILYRVVFPNSFTDFINKIFKGIIIKIF